MQAESRTLDLVDRRLIVARLRIFVIAIDATLLISYAKGTGSSRQTLGPGVFTAASVSLRKIDKTQG